MIRSHDWALLVLGSLCGIGGVFAADDRGAIKIENIPSELRLPMPAGMNKVLTVKISNAKVRSVWLAREKNSPLRGMLTRTDAGTYQVNLADPGMKVLLDSGKAADQFHIFAETEDGKMLQSIPVAYSFWQPGSKPKLFAKFKSNSQRQVLSADVAKHWIDPDSLERLEVRADPVNGTAVHARFETQNLEFARIDESGTFVLAADAKLRSLWNEKPLLNVVLERNDEPIQTWELRAIPSKLAYTGYGPTVTVQQRQSAFIPGTNEYISIKLDDVTASQVILTVETADGKRLIEPTSVRDGDEITIPIGKRNYTLTVHKLVNILIGDNDFGIFTVSEMAQSERRKIDKLIHALELTPLRFIRDGSEYSGHEAADHMREKLKLSGDSIKTAEDFIVQIASRSSLKGTPYKVKLRDGTIMDAQAWLRQKLTELKAQSDAPTAEKSAIKEGPKQPK